MAKLKSYNIKVCKSMQKYAKVRKSTQKYAKVRKITQKWVKVCKSMQSMQKYANRTRKHGGSEWQQINTELKYI